MFTFNDKVYYYVLKPTAKGYKAVVPEQARISVRKVFTNVAMPIRFTNCVLQGKMKGAGVEVSRFVINTTVGILGLFDPAKSYCKMNPYDEDFDQTLGYYCIEPGFFIVWPFLGPSKPTQVGLEPRASAPSRGSAAGASGVGHQRRLTSVCSTWSCVLMVCALAW